MRRSQHTEGEILHLLDEARSGVPVAEICSTAHVSLRTFYRWRRRFGGLTPAAVQQMHELEAENRRLKAMVDNLSERLRTPLRSEVAAARSGGRPSGRLEPIRASMLAAERCGGALVGRFASVRVTR